MKPIYILLTCMILIFSGIFATSINAQSTDTIKQIPFIETWESGSFDTNGWSFPYMQGNWTILTTEGNPEPCAAFPGYPSNSTYLYALESPWFDATQLTCDQIFLEFDLKLETTNPTGLEKFRVELITDSLVITIYTNQNSSSFSWNTISLDLSYIATEAFQLRFYTQGSYSPSITGWLLDNIHITKECKRPTNFENWEVQGYCSYQDTMCNVLLVWEPPHCYQGSEILKLIFDDGTAENAWTISPGYLAWLGNEFPISSLMYGTIQSFDVWFGWGYPSTQHLTIDVFDQFHNLLGSSFPFTTPSEDWKNVQTNPIPFSGPFYAMVKWDMLPTGVNFFGYDENGPYASSNLAWYHDGLTWDHMSTVAGTVPGSFLIRASVNVIMDAMNRNNDSTILLGYNIYFYSWLDTDSLRQFIKINQEPVTDTFCSIAITCMGDWYITAIFSDSCESLPTYEISAGCWVSIPENQAAFNVMIKPNPASDFFEIESSVPFMEIRIIDMLGIIRYNERFSTIQVKQVKLPEMASGSYIVSIQTVNGPVNRKLIITR